jgi:chromosome segregation ATPase
VKNMSEENREKAQEEVGALKARIAELEAQLKAKDGGIAELEAENEKLKTAIAEATETLVGYVEKEKEAAIKDILEKANFCEDELKRLDLAQLKLVQKSVNSVKGTVKNIRSAGAEGRSESGLTVGDLYHKE